MVVAFFSLARILEDCSLHTYPGFAVLQTMSAFNIIIYLSIYLFLDGFCTHPFSVRISLSVACVMKFSAFFRSFAMALYSKTERGVC